MVFLELFISFMKIGFTSFGGLSMVPLILDEMRTHGWMTTQDLQNLIGIAEMTPGPLGINCATFAGTRTAGFLGGLAAVFGVLMPAFTLTLIVSLFFVKFRKSSLMTDILSFVRPACIGMIAAVAIELSGENFFTASGINFRAIIIAAVAFFALLKMKWTVPKTIILSSLMGVLLYGIL
ncbi:MAG: chromate transporter [Lachnospiraceae bacterium]|nr:chromate transporter [Lachnospiraceae bacterium]